MSESTRVIVTGATGLIGKRLCADLRARGHQVIIFSRSPDSARQQVPDMAGYVAWDAKSLGAWGQEIDGAHAVIHLAGAPIFGTRWTESYKQTLYDSRIFSTRALVEAMRVAQVPPATFLCGSAVGYYGARGDTRLDEHSPPQANNFLASLTHDWEAEGQQAVALGVRTVLLRTGIVMARDGGALPLMKLPFQFYVGGPILPGTQWLSWIHVDDQVGLILWALEHEHVSGPLNLSAPEPQTNADFSATLARTLGTPSWLPVPGLGLKLALGEFADSLTTGQRVIPQKALDMGYAFQHPTAAEALRDLLR